MTAFKPRSDSRRSIARKTQQSEGSRRNPAGLNKHINFKRESEKGNARKEPTEVMCIQCKKKFILPFKPRKPEVYCDDCFKKKNKK